VSNDKIDIKMENHHSTGDTKIYDRSAAANAILIITSSPINGE
jgi:hypothetical protein